MDSRKVIKYLKLHGQQQTLEAIRDSTEQEVTREDLAKLVEDGKLVEVDGGVDYRGEPQTHYMAADDGDTD